MSNPKPRNRAHDKDMPLGVLTISTSLRLDPEFIANPATFAQSRGIKLAGDFNPVTIFRRNKETDSKDEEEKGVIHLLEPDAISLKVGSTGGPFQINTIAVDPSLLLYGDKWHPLVESDLARALSVLQDTVRPLLANPEDACHIVPGLVAEGSRASWTSIQCRLLLPGVDLRTLHKLDHHLTGPPGGADDRQIRLGGGRKPLEILFERKGKKQKKGKEGKKGRCPADGEDGAEEIDGTLVTVTIRKHLLQGFKTSLNGMPPHDSTLPGFHPSAVSTVLDDVVADLQGIHLPVPEEWADMGDPVTVAKNIALLSVLTDIPIDELKAWDREIRQPSESTLKRLEEEITVLLPFLKPEPVSTLFQQIETQEGMPRCSRSRSPSIDPSIAALYGPQGTPGLTPAV